MGEVSALVQGNCRASAQLVKLARRRVDQGEVGRYEFTGRAEAGAGSGAHQRHSGAEPHPKLAAMTAFSNKLMHTTELMHLSHLCTRATQGTTSPLLSLTSSKVTGGQDAFEDVEE